MYKTEMIALSFVLRRGRGSCSLFLDDPLTVSPLLNHGRCLCLHPLRLARRFIISRRRRSPRVARCLQSNESSVTGLLFRAMPRQCGTCHVLGPQDLLVCAPERSRMAQNGACITVSASEANGTKCQRLLLLPPIMCPPRSSR